MKIAMKLKRVFEELLRYVKWLLKHYDEFAPIMDIAKRLVEMAEAEGGTGGEKRIRVRERIKRLKRNDAFATSTTNYAIEKAVAELKDKKTETKRSDMEAKQ